MRPVVAAPIRRFTQSISGDLRDGCDPADAAKQRALAHAGLAAIVPQEMQDVAELMVREQASQQGTQLHRALRQRMVGEHRGVKMAVELPRAPSGRRWAARGPFGARATTPAMSAVVTE